MVPLCTEKTREDPKRTEKTREDPKRSEKNREDPKRPEKNREDTEKNREEPKRHREDTRYFFIPRRHRARVSELPDCKFRYQTHPRNSYILKSATPTSRVFSV